MNAGISQSKRLHWWFWLLLFTPVVLNVFGLSLPGAVAMQPGERTWFSDLVWVTLLVLNVGCSLLAAAQLERSRTGLRSAWTIKMAVLFFFMNVVLSFGGCAAVIFLA